ncbi:MAG: nucleotide-binding universal stress UspA family protein [Cyclobacteriaceae bacterium]|jgi:nucleotide-binding universal stress UspA family protein
MINASIDLIYINTPEYFKESCDIKKLIEPFQKLAGSVISNEEIIDAETFEGGLEKYCENRGDGLVLMANHGKKGFGRFFTDSLIERIINHVDVPVLSFRI